jgi:hypothetical protein
MPTQGSRQPGGSAARWGPLFGGRARDWAETWEGPRCVLREFGTR